LSKPWNKLIVALDVTSEKKINAVSRALSPKGVKFKIGPIAYTKFGPEAVRMITRKKADVFLDFKLYDIPNTMAETAKQFVGLGVWAFTVHLKAGHEALAYVKKEIAKEARRLKKKRPLIIGVTELTSKNAPINDVVKLAGIANKSGIDGVVCSVWEAKTVKKKFGLKIITPGIRSKKCGDDQRRVATAKQAFSQGSDYIVVGRPIVKATKYLSAAEEVLSV